jgi:hypothetical protein
MGRTIIVVNDVNSKNVTVNVDAKSNAEAGILLRFKDRGNFLLANYAPQNNAIYFHEVVNNNYGPYLGAVTISSFGPDIHLTARVEGSEATFTVRETEMTKKYGNRGS